MHQLEHHMGHQYIWPKVLIQIRNNIELLFLLVSNSYDQIMIRWDIKTFTNTKLLPKKKNKK